ncbi:MAG: hypothetical protein K2Y71_20375 [Xanthobacteraceae bacterium]|nr:hypothetical protein [Xanthobacteraceae bacterium]
MSESKTNNAQCTCTVEVSPDEADAGTDITLNVQVTAAGEDGLRALRVSIRDGEGAELAQAELAEAEDEDDTYIAEGIVVPAPRTAGEHVYRALVLSPDRDGAWQEVAASNVRVVVKAHGAALNVWDMPSAIEAGSRFKFMVGVRCSAGCCLAAQGLAIVDGDGKQIGAAKLGSEIWPETDALYVAEVEAEAPSSTGSHQWEVRTAAWDCALPHETGAVAVSLRVVAAPDYEVTIEAIDREKQTPIKDARVVMHPYRATTDENGVARVKVTRGHYEIFVSAAKYVSIATSADVTADMITRAELDGDSPWVNPDEYPIA